MAQPREVVMRVSWIVLVIACSGKNDKPASEATPASGGSASAAIACPDRVARVGNDLSELASATPGFMPIVQGIDAPASAAGKPFDTRGFVVAIARDGSMFVQGDRLATIADVRDRLDAMHKRSLEQFVMDGGSARDARYPLYIWADRAAPAGAVAAVLAATVPQVDAEPADGNPRSFEDDPPPPEEDDPPPPEEEPDERDARARARAIEQARTTGIVSDKPLVPGSRFVPRLLVAGTPARARASEPAAVSAIAAKLPASEPAATTYVVGVVRGAMGACKPLIMAIATASLDALPWKETAKLVQGVPAGLAECECKIPDPDLFEWGLRAWFGGWAPSLAWIEMPEVATGDKQPIGRLVK